MKKMKNLGVFLFVLMSSGFVIGQVPDADLDAMAGGLDGIWPSIRNILALLLGIAGGIFLVIAAVVYFTTDNNDKAKAMLLRGLIGFALASLFYFVF